MADIVVADNRPDLQTIADDWNTAAGGNTGRRPTRAIKSGAVSGNGALTAIVFTHGLGFTPGKVIVNPTSAAAATYTYTSAKTATQFTLNFSAAPASGTNNVTFDYEAVQ